MWLGEQITERGIGNGISLIIFAGIVAGLQRGWEHLRSHASEKIPYYMVWLSWALSFGSGCIIIMERDRGNFRSSMHSVWWGEDL